MSDATTTGKATASDALANAAVCCEMARDNEDAGDSRAAYECYVEAEMWLTRADLARGIDGRAARLDARAELGRRMGLG